MTDEEEQAQIQRARAFFEGRWWAEVQMRRNRMRLERRGQLVGRDTRGRMITWGPAHHAAPMRGTSRAVRGSRRAAGTSKTQSRSRSSGKPGESEPPPSLPRLVGEASVSGGVPVGWKGLDTLVLAEAGVELLAGGLVAVPYRDVTGCAWNRKVFAPGGRSWWEESGVGLLAPFGLERVADPARRSRRQLWIAEGESDCLALREHYAEWRNLPVDAIALPGSGTWRSEWRRHVTGYAAVYVFPDGDGAGDRMARRIAESVPWMIRVVMPPGSDVRAVLQGDGVDALDECIVSGEMAAVMLAGMRKCSSIADLEQFLAEVTW
jgi:hypothetical protein